MNIVEAVKTKILTLSAVTAITSVIRPHQLDQRDLSATTPAVLINLDKEDAFTDQNIMGTTDLIRATILVSAVSTKLVTAWSLSNAIKLNGTNPGTGLKGCQVRSGSLYFDAMWEETTWDEMPAIDGSDAVRFFVTSTYTVPYYEAF